MTTQEIVEAILDSLKVFTSWPVIIFALVLLFRKRVEESIIILTERLRSVSVGANSMQFGDSGNPSRALVRMTGMGLKGTSSSLGEVDDTEGMETLPETVDDETFADEAEIREFDQQIETLRD